MDFTNVMRNKKAWFSIDEINRLLQYCKDNNRDRDYMLLLTLARTGRRITEVVGKPPYTHYVGLRPVDIFDDGLIEWDILKKNHIKSKTKAGSLISPDRLIKKHLDKKPKRVLKPTDNDFLLLLNKYVQTNNIAKFERIFPISRQRADVILKDIAKKSEIVKPGMKIHCHMFRHSLAINLLKDNPDNPYMLIQVQKILDHSKLEMVAHYAQFTPEDIKKSLNKLFGGE